MEIDSMVWPGVSRTCKTQSRKFERVAVFHGDEGVLRFRLRSETYFRAAAVPQFEMPGDEIGMEVRQKNVADLHSELFGICKVLLDIALRIHHDAGRRCLIGNQIGSVRKTAEVVLLEEHARLL